MDFIWLLFINVFFMRTTRHPEIGYLMMTVISQIEKKTLARVVALFRDRLL